MFNFEIKYQSYKIALENTKQLLTNNNIDEGINYLNKAISISNELIYNCVVPELKNNLINENRQLLKLSNDLSNNKNPFIKKEIEGNENNSFEEEQTNTFFTKEPPTISLKDVAGLENVKEEIKLNILAPLKNPEIYYKYRDDVGCQILMYGPPGCGKSFVAEAIAGELKCAYAIINASDILDKYVGEAPKKIRQIFKEADTYDNYLIFFDELDALFSSRESDDSRYTKDVLTTFLTCLSGFNTNNMQNKIRVIIGATNRPWALDSALLRGKRFDTHLYIGLPDEKAREFLIKKFFNNHMHLLDNTNITIDNLIDLLEGYSGADISTILNRITNCALKRALKNLELNIDKDEPITYEDVINVLKETKNSVSKESLLAFEEYRNS